MKNVIKSAPEVTFWGVNGSTTGMIFDPSDYFFLNTSGLGGGAYNIPLGPGSLAIAYFGGNQKRHRRLSGAMTSASTISPSM